MSWTLEWGIPWKKQALYSSQEGLAVPKCLTNFFSIVRVAGTRGTGELPILHRSLLQLDCIRTEAVKEITRQGRRFELRAVMKSSQSESFAICISTQCRRISSETLKKKKSLMSWKYVRHLFNGSVDELGEVSREQRGVIWVRGYSWAVSTISTPALCSSLCFSCQRLCVLCSTGTQAGSCSSRRDLIRGGDLSMLWDNDYYNCQHPLWVTVSLNYSTKLAVLIR